MTDQALSKIFVIIVYGSMPSLKPVQDRYMATDKNMQFSRSSESWEEAHRMRNPSLAMSPAILCQDVQDWIIVGPHIPVYASEEADIRTTSPIEVVVSSKAGGEKSDTTHIA